MAALPSMELFRDRMTFAMSRAGMNQSQLARAVGVTPQNVQHMVRRPGENYRGSNLVQLANALNVPAGWLACNESADTPPARVPQIPMLHGLSALQVAGLEALASVMRSGNYSDNEVIDLLAALKPRLVDEKKDAPKAGA